MNRNNIILAIILIVAAFLRFYNLMFDSPYFFNPDEKNMAVAIIQFHLPNDIKNLPGCLFSSSVFYPLSSTNHNLQSIIYHLPSAECNLNPHFFAYGQFPLYLAFFSSLLINLLFSIIYHPSSVILSISFPQAIFWLRFWSALSSTFIVLLVFLISRKLYTLNFALLTAALCVATPVLIQSAHFGTTESLLTFFFISLIYLSVLYLSKRIHNLLFIILNSLILGLALSTKISALVYLPIPLLSLILTISKKRILLNISKRVIIALFIILASFFIFFLTSPFNFLDISGFHGSINYESAVATGATKVFYTRQFENTVPVLFQMQKIFPYALGLPIFILGSLGFLLMNIQLICYLILRLLQKYQILNIKYQKYIENIKIFNFLSVFLIFDFSFLIFFIPNAFLYAKWTRFLTPIFPLFSVFTGIFLYQSYILINKLIQKYQISNISTKGGSASGGKYQIYKAKIKKIFNFLYVFLIFTILFLIFLPGFAFFSIYLRPDTRVSASKWIYENIPSNSYVLSETANVVDIPVFLPSIIYNLPSIISFNFYDLDENPARFEELLTNLTKADYIFIPSRRIFANHTRLPQKYPLTSKYYELLFSGKLGFTKIAEFSSFPLTPLSSIIYDLSSFNCHPQSAIPNPQSIIYHLSSVVSDEQSEETWTVFDHPVIRIYQKKIRYNQETYRNLFHI